MSICLILKLISMTAKEKAMDLVYDMYNAVFGMEWEMAKQCALICANEILNAVTTIADKKYEYWQEVKEEINKL